MNCRVCGAKIADGAEVCISCGAVQQIVGDAVDYEVPEPIEIPSDVSVVDVAYDPEDNLYAPEQGVANKRNIAVLLGVAVLLVVCAAGIAFAINALRLGSAAQTQENEVVAQDATPSVGVMSMTPASSSQAYVVSIPIVAEGLTDEGSRIPVHVQGTANGGEAVAQDAYVSHDGSGLSLAAGTYEIRILESPISSDGVLYRVTGDTRSLRVEEGGACTVTPEDPFVCAPMLAQDVADEQIEAAITRILNDPERRDRATALRDAAYGRRNGALANYAVQGAGEYDETSYAAQASEADSQWDADAAYDASGIAFETYDSDASYESNDYSYDDANSYDYGADSEGDDSGDSSDAESSVDTTETTTGDSDDASESVDGGDSSDFADEAAADVGTGEDGSMGSEVDPDSAEF